MEQYHPDHGTYYYFAESHGKHHIWDGILYSIPIFQYKWDNQGICENRRERDKPFMFAQCIGAKRANQCGDAAENNIGGDCAAEKICKQASDKEPRYGSRSKKWQDGQRFRYAELDGSKTPVVENDDQDDVDGSNRCALHKMQYFFVSHNFALL